MKVLVSTHLLPDGFSELAKRFEIIFPEKDSFSRQEVMELLPMCDAFVPTFVYKVDKEMIDVAKNKLKIIANYGVGFNNIDIAYATECGIIVTNTPDPVIEPTAEQAFALMLAAARRIAEYDRKLRNDKNVKWGVMENLGHSVFGKTLGIVGMGRIGKAMARRALASGMNIRYYNRHQLSPETEAKYRAQYLLLDELLTTSDVISLHTPLTDETHHLINSERLQKMKSDAILINTARGAVVDEQALVYALKNNWIGSAGLDVFEQEPDISPALFELDNVVLAPHNGTATVDTRNEMARQVSENIIRFFAGDSNITRVN